jgi:hypothetical protein
VNKLVIPSDKINKSKNLLILLLLFSITNCYSYEIMLHSKYDTIKTRRITLPPKMWASFDTTGEEDLRKYCGKKPLLLVKFRNNSPIEVWCDED